MKHETYVSRSKSSLRNQSVDLSNQSSDDGVDRSKDAGHFIWFKDMKLGKALKY
jgi:hypothetical protein